MTMIMKLFLMFNNIGSSFYTRKRTQWGEIDLLEKHQMFQTELGFEEKKKYCELKWKLNILCELTKVL